MGIVLFVVMALAAGAAIVYPLLPGRAAGAWAAGVTDDQIERAVRRLRRSRSGVARSCPGCGQPYEPGDRFCVRCGASLPDLASPQTPDAPEGARSAAVAGLACPSCGAALRPGDQFCAGCGHVLHTGGAA